MLEKTKRSIDRGKVFVVLTTHFSRAFDCLPQVLITAKLNAYEFSLLALRLIQNHPPEVFYETGVLKNFVKFTGKHLSRILFFNEVAGFTFEETTTLPKRKQKNKSNSNSSWKDTYSSNLRDLAPIVQLRKRENTHGGVLLLVKLQALAFSFANSNTFPLVFFTFFKLYKRCQIAKSVSYWKTSKKHSNNSKTPPPVFRQAPP